jgi:HK97 family phage prohead protease
MPLDPEIIDQDPECELIPSYLRSLCATTIKVVNKEAREVAHIITTVNPDRVGDVVEASGADLANYLRHPVVMADHSYSIERIIGKATALTVDEKGIFARTKYRDTPLAKDAFNLASEGLGAWSIGFRPIAFKAMKDDKGITKGFRFTKWEMLEYSQVAIPMNADAVQQALSKGWVQPENIKTFFRAEELKPPSKDAALEPNVDSIHTAQMDPKSEARILAAVRRAQWRFTVAESAQRITNALKELQ